MAAKVKKGCVFLTAFVLAMAFLPFAKMINIHADNSSNASSVLVNFTSQYDGEFLHAPQFGYEVSSDLAEDYGYGAYDHVENAVSVLDVLVAAHKLRYGDAFTPQTATQYLAFNGMGVQPKQFEVYNFTGDFFFNHAFANDGTTNPYNINEYNPTDSGTQAVQDGDLVEFFFYEDFDLCDTYNWFVDTNGVYSRTFEMTAGENIALKLKGIDNSYVAQYRDEEELVNADEAEPIVGAQIYLVNLETGALTAMENETTNNNGVVTLNLETPGTYTITAGTGNAEYTQIMSLTTIHVKEAAAPKFSAHRLRLGDEIGVSFGMDLSVLDEAARASSYMEFTVNGNTTRVDTKDAEQSDAYDVFTCFINSVQMAEPITAVFHYNNTYIQETYSAKQYVINALGNGKITKPEDIALIKAIADYGHFSQPFLANANGWVIGTQYQEMDLHYAESYDYDIVRTAVDGNQLVFTKGSSKVSSVLMNLALNSKTTVRVKMMVDGDAELTATATFHGKTFDAVKQNDGSYIITITGVTAAWLGDDIIINGNAGGEFTITVSALSYVQKILNSSTYENDLAAKNAVSALYYYYRTTVDYRIAHNQ